MTIFVLNGVYGVNDTFTPTINDSHEIISINLFEHKKELRFGIGLAIKDLKRLGLCPTAIALDLGILAVLVHAADTRISRLEAAQDAWTREIKLVVPVSDVTKWSTVVILLQEMLRFLTGDMWTIEFRQKPVGFEGMLKPSLVGLKPVNYDGVALFSGGLDSFIGAIDSLKSGQNLLFVSHAGERAVSDLQGKIFNKLKEKFATKPIERLRIQTTFSKGLVSSVGSENSTRGRSFLFFALGVFVGSSLRKEFILRVPENGLISLNIPLDPTRLGASSTRTTHPYYIYRWNQLLEQIGIPCLIENPYWNKTKGEMVSECLDREVLAELLPLSLSCAHPGIKRFNHGIPHCGYCLPCIIRKAAIEKAWGKGNDTTDYYLTNLNQRALDATKAEGVQVRAFQYALSKLNANSNLASLWIHKSGPLTLFPERLSELIGVYSRGMQEVNDLLASVTTFSSKAN